ncbi:hypothetical protein Rsub_07616 [Raphidocelis subcapitata]|uniref:SAC3/GANP/THP3 conserved domain-containing protein n=1 Tax=Raphidocelis subcapitata TaxID=307507 RepID=A0A2V0PA03_9CHLO|nr:hypothetical protein Rsub_07616 [Raphidocelis subcapitata]|eukprot:GBF94733.1 hypothetical protein Rsub_07616 [Raphidocelis subcapitata]
MAQPYGPYAGYGQPTPEQQAYYGAGYGAAPGYGAPPPGAYSGYDPGYAQQQGYGYDQQQAAAYWYAQQQQQAQQQAQYGAAAPPLPPGQPPPLPPDQPPPLPSDAPPAGQGQPPLPGVPPPTPQAQAQQPQQQQQPPQQGYGAWAQQPQAYGAWAQQPQYGAYPQQQPQQQTPQPAQQQPRPQTPGQQQQNTPAPQGGYSSGAVNYSAVPPPASLAPRPRPAGAWGAPPSAAAAPAAPAYIPVGASPAAGAAAAAADAVARMRATAQAKASELAAAAPRAAPKSFPGASPAPAAASARPPPPAAVHVFSPSPAAARGAAAAAAAAAPPAGLPQALSAWVQRCLEVYKAPMEKSWIKEHLKDYMIQVRAAGTIWTTDWDRHPIPRPPWAGGGAAAGAKRPRGGLFGDSSSEGEEGDAWALSPRGGRGRGRARGRGGRGAPGTGKKARRAAAAAAAAAAGEDEGAVSAGEEAKRARRAGRFEVAAPPGAFEDRVAYMRHKKRLVEQQAERDGDDIDWDRFKIVGSCQRLEKSYLRLTSAPDPSEVRPPAVLRRALERLLALVAEGEGGGYFYYNDQFKAMRQDLTVQGIRDELAVQVYEAHARAALEYGDHAEYNQCQAQLALLYAAGTPGAHAEFAAYRLLYQSVHARHGEGRKLAATLRQVLDGRVGAVAASPEVAHALAARAAIAARSYSRFFQLYASAPHLGRALLDVHVPSMRWHALNALARAYRPGVPFDRLAAAAGFVAAPGGSCGGGGGGEGGAPAPGRRTRVFPGEHEAAAGAAAGLAEAEEWARSCGAVLTRGPDGERLLDCKACSARGALHLPPVKDKVAHGDANLDIHDFLAKIGV